MQSAKADFDQLTQGFKSKSDKIRTLARHGVPTADIANYLGIRYQHARNVLVGSGLHKLRTEAGEPSPASGSEAGGTGRSAWARIDDAGRLQLPAGLMEAAGLRAGEQVNVRVSGDGIEVLSKRAALQRAQEIVGDYVPPGASLVDELIAERRREAHDDEPSAQAGAR